MADKVRHGLELRRNEYSSLAQSVERSAVNRNVVGSSPTGGAILIPILFTKIGFFCADKLRNLVVAELKWQNAPVLFKRTGAFSADSI